MKKVTFMALATVFMFSSGFAVPAISEEQSLIEYSEKVSLSVQDIYRKNVQNNSYEDKICRYRFVNPEGETIAVIDIVVDTRDNCRRDGLINAAIFEYEAGLYVGLYKK